MPRIRTMPALVVLLALAATSASRVTRAEDCLAGPNAQAPQGSHWYYRLDRATHRKCWYVGAQHAQRAQRRRSAERADSTPAESDEDVPVRDAPVQTGIVAAPPDPSFSARSAEQPPRASADLAPVTAAPTPPTPSASPPAEGIGPRTVATTTERVRPPVSAKAPETAKPAAAAAIPPAPSEPRGALPAALFGIALLLAAVGTMLVRARRRVIRVHDAARRPRRTLSDILAQAERGEPARADAASKFFDRLRRGLDETGARTAPSPDERAARYPGAANDMPDIAAATLQPQIEELPPEPIEPAPDFEQSLRQLLAEWERRAA